MKEGRIKEGWIKGVERTDETGKCFKSEKGGYGTHYYRQDRNRVLHIGPEVINTLADNHIEEARINWGDRFKEIEPSEFEEKLTKTIEIFYQV